MNRPTEANAPQNLAEAIGLVRQKQFPFSPLPRIFKYLFLLIKQELCKEMSFARAISLSATHRQGAD